ncbi:MAG: D-hexose-6-phosphate mutarotase [Roseiflexaceae bacterium]
MLTTDPDVLNEQFAIAQHITFAATAGGLPVAEIHNSHAAASVAVQGGHVITFQPHGQQPVLWVSSLSAFEPGKTIRGGIPVCWPWFGAHPADPSKPFHGFVRAAMWQVRGTSVGPADATEIRLGLTESEATLALWPYAFDLEIVVTVGAQLRVELITRNPGEQPFVCGGALHSYYTVGDARRIAIHGLDGCDYLDKVEGFKRKTQHGPVTIEGETDRVYLDTDASCVIDDSALDRRIRVAKAGSRTTVVWNPWAEKAHQLADFGDEEYLSMVCVETANADTDIATVAPGGEHRLNAVIGLQ